MTLNLLKPINVNKSILEKLHTLNLHTYWDLLLHIPIRYEDLTSIYLMANASVGTQVLVEGEILITEVLHKRTKQLQVKITDHTQIITLIFFHFYPNYASQYPVGKKIRAYGEIKLDYYGQKTITHPKIQTVRDNQELPNTFSPIYSVVQGLSQLQITKVIDEALDMLNIIEMVEILPGNLISNYYNFKQSIFTLHKLTPKQFANKLHLDALSRLKLDEIIAQQLIMYNIYQYKHDNSAISIKQKGKYTESLLQQLPFKLTKAQLRVLKEIYADLAKPTQMNRLLQGDVGSGKTIVATLAMLVAVENNYQACIIAPTEILAQQHYFKTKQLLECLGIEVICLSGSLTPKEKKIAYAKIADYELSGGKVGQIIIGTHAVFQASVVFKSLALVIIDEQHRFGVKQRLSLQEKGNNPHQLMMSATPIPRSLAMSYYADLDLSIINELPPGRTPIKTILVNNTRRYEVISFIESAIAQKRQIYWVCPLIEESEKLNLENVLKVYTELQAKFPNLGIGLIHGKLKSVEKSGIMHSFNAGELSILVATTVIEVGVDVPNASVMVIEHSERMGLSALHQLRGRIGRGVASSDCILLYQNPLSDVAKKRLKAIHNNTDGFKIAHEDLLIRGPGELLGNRQSGVPLLKFANLELDLHLIPIAQGIAKKLSSSNPDLAQTHTKLWFHNQEFFLKA
jgi:ATP-dependent DNA helicase RecG